MSEHADVELLTLREANKLVGRRRGYVEAEIAAGRIRFCELEPGRVRVPAYELRRWIDAQLRTVA